MTIEEIMDSIIGFGAEYEFGSPTDINLSGMKIHVAIEQYAKDASEEMRKKCIAAVSSEKQFDYAYNDAINDAIKAIEEIK